MAEKNMNNTLTIVYGIHPVCEVARAKRRFFETIYTTREPIKAWRDIQKLLTPKTRIVYVSKDQLTRIAGSEDHQGVVGITTPFAYRKSFFDVNKSPFILLLDRIQDPRNLGAIIRSAYCTGVDGIVVIKRSGVDITSVVIKSSAGLVEHCDIYQAPTVPAAVELLKKAGYTIYSGALGGTPIQQITFKQPCCIVVGNEGLGVASEFIKNGVSVMLAQREADISYNASVAAGILLFNVSLQLGRIK